MSRHKTWVLIDPPDDTPGDPRAFAQEFSSADTRHHKATVNEVLAPWRRSTPVIEVTERCECVGIAAHQWAQGENFRDLPEVNAAARQIRTPIQHDHTHWLRRREAAEAYLDYTRRIRARQHPLHDTPDPDCAICAGAGAIDVWRNPGARFDGYTFGGVLAPGGNDAQDPRLAPRVIVAGGAWHDIAPDESEQVEQILAAHPYAAIVVLTTF